jgi:hypothetical protein
MNLKKRIEQLERDLVVKETNRLCICLPVNPTFHTSEEHSEAKKIPCPVHGKRCIGFTLITGATYRPLHPADRHLCHCAPSLYRQAAEEGRTLTAEEERVAHEQGLAEWEEMARPWREQLERECLERVAARKRALDNSDSEDNR